MGFLPTSHSFALQFPFEWSLSFSSFLLSLPVSPLGANFLLRTRGIAFAVLVRQSKMAGVVHQERSPGRGKENQGLTWICKTVSKAETEPYNDLI